MSPELVGFHYSAAETFPHLSGCVIVVPTALCGVVSENKQLEIAKAIFQTPLANDDKLCRIDRLIVAHFQSVVVPAVCEYVVSLRGDFSDSPSATYVIIIHGSITQR